MTIILLYWGSRVQRLEINPRVLACYRLHLLIMFDEKQWDPHGVGSLSHILTINNKSSTFWSQRKIWVLFWCFNKVPVFFWLNFKLKRAQGLAVESMLMSQDVLVYLLTAYRKSLIHCITNIQGNETAWRSFPVYQHHQRPDCQRKITFDSFSSAKLCQQQILCLHVVMKKIYNFPKKSELPKFIPMVKISWLNFFCCFWCGKGWKWKICRDQSRLTFSSHGFIARFHATHACAPTWACL